MGGAVDSSDVALETTVARLCTCDALGATTASDQRAESAADKGEASEEEGRGLRRHSR
jgi:hypothetical protein